MGLFGDKSLKFVGVTGPISCGKTLFGLSIDPQCRDFSNPPGTLVIDDEFSTDAYKDVRHFDRKDIGDFVNEKDPMELIWEKIYNFFLKIPVGKYRVGGFDTLNTPEKGLEAWVKKNPQFGHTLGQYEKMTAIMQDDMKQVLMQFLTRVVAPRFEVFYWTAHEKVVWEGNSPTNKRRPQGRDTWMKCAHLYLRLNRERPPMKAAAPDLPKAIILKSRTLQIDDKGGESSWLPEAMADCTPDKIREYAATPADRKKLKKSEQLTDRVTDGVIEEEMSDDERLRIQAQIEENKRATSETALEIMQRKQESLRAMKTPGKVVWTASSGTTSATPVVQKPKEIEAEVLPAEAKPEPTHEEWLKDAEGPAEAEEELVVEVAPNPPTDSSRIKDLWVRCGYDADTLGQKLEANYGVSNPDHLNQEKSAHAISVLEKVLAKQGAASGN